MSKKVGATTKTLVMLMTCILQFICVHSLMSKKIRVPTEALTAVLTLIGPLSRVDPEMNVKI